MTRRVMVFDTTLRDGEQAPGNSLSVEEKVRLARQLEVLGVDVIEAGFPASSETDFRSEQEIPAQGRRPVIAAPLSAPPTAFKACLRSIVFLPCGRRVRRVRDGA